MANLKVALTPEEVKKLGVANVRTAYNALANDYNRIVDGNLYYCHCCNEFHPSESFYSDKRYASGLFPECKKTLLKEACDYDPKTKLYSDNKEKTIEVFRKLDLPFIESLYNSALQTVQAEVGEKNRQTAYQHVLVMLKSLPNWKGKTFKDSEFFDTSEFNENVEVKRIRKEIRKIFGGGYTEQDYAFLQEKYDDFKSRTAVDSISQEVYVQQICLQLLEIDKDRKNGKDVTNKLKSLDTLMASANLQPKQNVGNASTDTLTFGQLIEKWELEKPIPEPSEEFKDVDGVGKYIRVWFSGWLSKALGLNNVWSKEFDEEVKKYSVSKAEYDESEQNSDSIYAQIFGNEVE